MIPELGKHGFAVLACYGVTVGMILGLVGLSLARGAKVRRQLDEVEARRHGNG